MQTSLLLSTAALIALSATGAFAADADNASGAETVVVSATRTEQPLDVTGASVSVITAQDIETQQTTILQNTGIVQMKHDGSAFNLS